MLKRLREPAPKYPALRTQEHVTFRDLSVGIAVRPSRHNLKDHGFDFGILGLYFYSTHSCSPREFRILLFHH